MENLVVFPQSLDGQKIEDHANCGQCDESSHVKGRLYSHIGLETAWIIHKLNGQTLLETLDYCLILFRSYFLIFFLRTELENVAKFNNLDTISSIFLIRCLVMQVFELCLFGTGFWRRLSFITHWTSVAAQQFFDCFYARNFRKSNLF